MRSRACSLSARIGSELFVTNTTRWPRPRRSAIASTEPGIRARASQTTPSRSQSTVGGIVGHVGTAVATCPRAALRALRRHPLRRERNARRRQRPAVRRAVRRDVDELAEQDPHNIVHIDVPAPGRLPEPLRGRGDVAPRWRTDGVLVDDDRPTFTLYSDAVHRRGRRRPPHRRCDRCPRGRRPRRRRGAAPRAPRRRRPPPIASTSPGDQRQPLAGVGTLADGGPDRLLAGPAEPIGSCTDEAGVVHTVER